MYAFIFFLIALFSSLFILSSSEKISNSLKYSFSIDLIHHDSPLSPFHNTSLTHSQHIKNAALRSISRINRFYLLSLKNQNDIQSPGSIIIPDNGDYLMKIYIGTPPLERFVVADTGSDLIWVQCSPCKDCFPQETPFFDPNKSVTFTNVSCESQECQLLPLGYHACGISHKCQYFYQYGDKSFTIGELSSDEINFGNNITFSRSIFGCGFRNHFTFPTSGKPTGIVGLGGGPLSLVSQLGDQIGRKFSYCLVPLDSATTSKLKFGNEATIKGEGVVSTPLIIKPETPTFYFLNLEGVTIGAKTVSTGQTNGNIIIDSGTTLTYLTLSYYTNFVTSLQSSIYVEAEQDIPHPFDFCFKYQEGMYFPDIVLQFKGANVPLKPKNLFVLFDDYNLLCLAVVPTKENGISILGNLAQVDFQVEYDLGGKHISFAPTDCTTIN